MTDPSRPLPDVADPALATATELLALYRAGRLSPVEATQAVLARADRLDPALNALCHRDDEAALAAAGTAQERWARSEPCGLLDGVPVTVKDLLLTRGVPTRRGSLTVDPRQEWAEDAPAVARLREHGAVVVGRTTTPEFGWKGVTDSPLTGVSRNPWDPTRTPGGSSGGSAAAVAAGIAPLSVGTDGGGSVRIPAGFCGVVGLKPTYGRVPLYPASPFGTLSHAGPITRTAEDAALLLDVLSGPDERDWSALAPAPPVAGRLEAGSGRRRADDPWIALEGLRIAYSPTLGHADVHPDVAEMLTRAVTVMDGLGARVEQVDPGFDDPLDTFETLWFAGAAALLDRIPTHLHELVDPGLREVAEHGARLSAVELLHATTARMDLGVLMGRFHTRYDLLLTPTLPLPAFEAGHEVPPGSPGRRWTTWTPFTYPFNLTQQPAVTVPCGLTGDGLPVGLQLVAARHADALVLHAAHAYQQVTGGSPLRPPEP